MALLKKYNHVGLPSSLSRNVVYDLLSRELHFKGLIFTDALSMKGVSGNEMVCLKALKAGNDMLLVPDRLKEEVQSVVDAIKSGDMVSVIVWALYRRILLGFLPVSKRWLIMCTPKD